MSFENEYIYIKINKSENDNYYEISFKHYIIDVILDNSYTVNTTNCTFYKVYEEITFKLSNKLEKLKLDFSIFIKDLTINLIVKESAKESVNLIKEITDECNNCINKKFSL